MLHEVTNGPKLQKAVHAQKRHLSAAPSLTINWVSGRYSPCYFPVHLHQREVKNSVRSCTHMGTGRLQRKTTKVVKTEWWLCVWCAEDQEDSGLNVVIQIRLNSSDHVAAAEISRPSYRTFRHPIASWEHLVTLVCQTGRRSERNQKERTEEKQIKTESNGAVGGMCVLWLARYLAFSVMALKVSGYCQWCRERLDEGPPLGHRVWGDMGLRLRITLRISHSIFRNWSTVSASTASDNMS